MIRFAKYLIAVLVLSYSALAMAGGSCEGKTSFNQDFCQDNDKDACGVHSSVCTWKEKQKVEVVINNGKKSCVAKKGQEAQESFCNGNDREECAVHSALCVWE